MAMRSTDGSDDDSTADRVALVLDPAFDFAALADTLTGLGWRETAVASQPLLAGEPEHAVFESACGRLHYTFNPACRLRVAELPGGIDASTLDALPAASSAHIAGWLRSADERSVLRGVLAARQTGDTGLLDLVEARRAHPRQAVARAAAQAADALRARHAAVAVPPEPAATAAFTAIELLRRQLEPVLLALGQDADGALAATLRPRDGDHALAFRADVAAAARSAYEAVWAARPRVVLATADSRLKTYLAPAGMLADDNALSRHFPLGYRAIAPLLQPHRVWVAWKLVAPGHSAGMAYDGLVWLDDHWAWFPKPYRVLAKS